MKKSLVARGFIGAVASLLGVAAVGCGAEVGDGAAGDSAEIGSSEQAISINTAKMHTPGDDSVTDTGTEHYMHAFYPSLIKLSETKVLVAGGYKSVGGAASDAIKAFSYTGGSTTGTWADVVHQVGGVDTNTVLAQAAGEAQIIEIPGNAGKFYMIGGRSSDGGTILDKIQVIDTTLAGGRVTVTNAGTLTSPRVNFTVQKCGSALLVSGGITTGGSPVDTLEVITGGTSPVSAVLKDDSVSPRTITMANPRAFHAALSFASDLTLKLVGGDSGAGTVGTTELLKIKSGSACTMDKNAVTPDGLGAFKPTAGNDLPSSAVRSQHVFAPVSITISSVAYDGLVAAGVDGSSVPTATFAYRSANDTWQNTGTPSLTTGQARPAFAAKSDNSEWALVGGTSFSVASLVDTNIFTNSGAGSFASPQDLDNKRLGAVAAYMGTSAIDDETSGTDGINPVAFHGQDNTTLSPTFKPRPE